MNRGVLVGLVGASVLLAGWIFGVELPRRAGEAQRADSADRVFTVDLDRLVRIAVDRPDDPLTLECAGGEWVLRRPFTETLDPSGVQVLLDFLREARRIREVGPAPTPDRRDEFGLGEFRFVLGLEDEAGAQQELVVGAPQPGGEGRYAVLDDQLWLVSSAVDRAVEISPHRLRRTPFWDVADSSITALVIGGPDGEIRARRRADGLWLDPQGQRLRRAPLDEVAYALSTTLVQGFVRDGDAGPLAASFGLAVPQRWVEATASDGRTLRVDFGREEAERGTFVWRSAPPGIVLVLSYLPEVAALDPKDVVDRSLLDRNFRRLVEVRVRAPGQEVVAERRENKWFVGEGGDDLQHPQHLAFRNALTELESAPVRIALGPEASAPATDDLELELVFLAGRETLHMGWDEDARQLWVRHAGGTAVLPRQVFLSWRALLAVSPQGER